MCDMNIKSNYTCFLHYKLNINVPHIKKYMTLIVIIYKSKRKCRSYNCCEL